MLAIEAANARYLCEHPGQAFCLECLTALASAAGQDPEDRPVSLDVSFKAFRGTCFDRHEFCQVFCYTPAAGWKRTAAPE